MTSSVESPPKKTAHLTNSSFLSHPLLATQAPAFLWLALWWIWAAWACAGDWENTEAYSYGWFVPLLCFYFAWRRWSEFKITHNLSSLTPSPQIARLFIICSIVALITIPLMELVRQTPIYWRPLNWIITTIAFTLTSLYLYSAGGRILLRLFLFPILLFFTAVPWPSAIEINITQSLMLHVAANAAEILNILGIPARAQAQIIHLTVGPVGIDEACSGIRSLQTAVMLGFVFGEFLSLTLLSRLIFFTLAILITFPINLLRTLTLCLIAQFLGLNEINTWHDTVGYTFLAILILTTAGLAYLISRFFGSRPQAPLTQPSSSPQFTTAAWQTYLASPVLSKIHPIRFILIAGIICFSASHIWYLTHEFLYPEIQTPRYTIQSQPQIQIGDLEPESQKILLSDYGKTFRCTTPPQNLPCPMGFHIFWKTSRANGKALTHRPDICMPSVGWKIDGEVTRKTYPLAGRPLDWYAFNFIHPASGQRALMLWGLLTDNQNIDLDFNRFIYLQRDLIATFIKKAQRRFSVEVLAISIPINENQQLSPTQIETLLNAYFMPRPNDSPPSL
jgi:exosortase